MIVDMCVKDPKSASEDNPGKRKGKVLERASGYGPEAFSLLAL